MKIKKIVLVCSLVSLFLSGACFGVIESHTGKSVDSAKYTLSYDQIKMAAESGDADAQYALGYMLYYGKAGATKDTNLAKMWIGKAASQKQPQAVKALALMNAKQVQGVTDQKTEDQTTQSKKATDEQPKESAKSTSNTEGIAREGLTHERTVMLDKREPKLVTTKFEPESLVKATSRDATYTLQLLGGSNKELIKSVAREHHLTSAQVYKTTFKGKDWYALLYGQFKTRSEATVTAKRFEQKLALKPWVKPLATIKQDKLSSAF